MLNLSKKLDEGKLVGDDAISTLLADRGIVSPYNGASLTHPQVVQRFLVEAEPWLARPISCPQARCPISPET